MTAYLPRICPIIDHRLERKVREITLRVKGQNGLFIGLSFGFLPIECAKFKGKKEFTDTVSLCYQVACSGEGKW